METTPEARPISLSEYEAMRQNERVMLGFAVMVERGYQSTHGWHGGHNSIPFYERPRLEDVLEAVEGNLISRF